MLVYLMRHGKAAPSEVAPERSLTEDGRAETEKMAEFARRLQIKVGAIQHSGKLRAQQTAEIISTAVESEEGASAVDGLMPNDDVGPWAAAFRKGGSDMMLVGHLPFMSRLVSRLLTGDEKQEIVRFEPSSLLCLERHDDGRWLMSFFLHPGVC